MQMLDKLFSIGIMGTLSLLIVPVTMAQGYGFDMDADSFVGATIDCSQWEENSFQRTMCEHIQERVEKHVAVQAELEAACGERANTDEYRTCVRDIHEAKREEMKAQREEIQAAYQGFDRGTDEHKTCVQENGGDAMEGMHHGRGRMGHMKNGRNHGFRNGENINENTEQ